MRILLYKKEYNSFIAWAVEEYEKVYSYITIELVATKKGIFFSVHTPNKSFNYINPFTAIFKAIECESIGMQKYTALKERVREIKQWQKL